MALWEHFQENENALLVFSGTRKLRAFYRSYGFERFCPSKIYSAREKTVRPKGNNEGIQYGEIIPRLESHFQQTIPSTGCHDSGERLEMSFRDEWIKLMAQNVVIFVK